MFYRYKAIEKNSGILEKGVVFACSSDELLKIMDFEQKILVSYKPDKILLFFAKRKFLEKFTLPFFKNLLSLTKNKMDILNSLKIIRNSFYKKEHTSILRYMIFKISNGKTLSEVMNEINIVFDGLSSACVFVAEKTATFEDAFRHIILSKELKVKIIRKLKNAIAYPLILFLTITSVIIFWIFFIIPGFKDSFTTGGLEISSVTRGLISFREFCINNIIVIELFCCAFILYLILLTFSNKFRKHKDYILSKLPFVKVIRRDIIVSNFFSFITVMLKEKLDLIESLNMSALSCDSFEMRKEILRMIKIISRGKTLTEAMKSGNFFKKEEILIIEAAESSSGLSEAFQTASSNMNDNINYKIDKYMSLIQPIVTIIMGGLLIIVVYSVFSPMYDSLNFY